MNTIKETQTNYINYIHLKSYLFKCITKYFYDISYVRMFANSRFFILYLNKEIDLKTLPCCNFVEVVEVEKRVLKVSVI